MRSSWWRLAAGVVAVSAIVLGGQVLVGSPATASSGQVYSSTTEAPTAVRTVDEPTCTLITDIQTESHGGFDRVIFSVAGPEAHDLSDIGWDAAYVTNPIDEADRPIPVSGDAILRFQIAGWDMPYNCGVDGQPVGPDPATGGDVVSVVNFQSWHEGYTTAYLGVNGGELAYEVSMLPDRQQIVVDIMQAGGIPEPSLFRAAIPTEYAISPESTEITLRAWPAQADPAEANPGDEFDLHEVEPSEVVFSPGSVEVYVPSSQIPASHIGSDGSAYFSVDVFDQAAGFLASTEFSARSIDLPACGEAWVDPIDVPEDCASARNGNDAASERVALSVRDGVDISSSLVNRFAEFTDERCEPVSDEEASRGGPFLVEETLTWATIGQTFMPGETDYSDLNSAWLEYSESTEQAASFGTAVSIGGAEWSQDHSKVLSGSWGMGFEPHSVGDRKYQIQVRYGLLKALNPVGRAFCSGDESIFMYQWEPLNTTGHSRTLDKNWNTYPRYFQSYVFSHCGPKSPLGTWSKSYSQGETYESATGVSFRGQVGFDLKSKTGNTSGVKIFYQIGQPGVKICGEGADASVAPRQMLVYCFEKPGYWRWGAHHDDTVPCYNDAGFDFFRPGYEEAAAPGGTCERTGGLCYEPMSRGGTRTARL
jgi:hypothetical protein